VKGVPNVIDCTEGAKSGGGGDGSFLMLTLLRDLTVVLVELLYQLGGVYFFTANQTAS